MAQGSSTGLFPFQWPHSSCRLTPWSIRSAELSVPTLDAACLVTVVRTVVHFVTLLCSVDTGPIATLEFIRSAGHQSFKTIHSSISYAGLESFVWYLLVTYLWHCWSFAPSVSKCHRALATPTKPTEAAAASATVLLFSSAIPDHPLHPWEKSPKAHMSRSSQNRISAGSKASWVRLKKASRQQNYQQWSPSGVFSLCERPGCFPARSAESH